MDEGLFLHELSVRTDVNIELLKDLLHNAKLQALIAAHKSIDAIQLVRSISPRVGLREAKLVVEALAGEMS